MSIYSKIIPKKNTFMQEKMIKKNERLKYLRMMIKKKRKLQLI